MEHVNLWLHLVAATVWVGPQFFLFLATMPSLRAIEDRETRLRVLRVTTRRFGWMALAALVVLVATGVENLRDARKDGFDIYNGDFRYVWVFTAKMGLLTLAVLATALHALVIGPRQLRLQEQALAADNAGAAADAARLRKLSAIMASVALLASLGILFAAALLADHSYSFQRV
ncbi:MAG TPA: DUF4149 domain-containing protein [Dehalococcoidia bacterium]|nr:DUF4149 domain-containing protein [Dehalococcoidia bacterium]